MTIGDKYTRATRSKNPRITLEIKRTKTPARPGLSFYCERAVRVAVRFFSGTRARRPERQGYVKVARLPHYTREGPAWGRLRQRPLARTPPPGFRLFSLG